MSIPSAGIITADMIRKELNIAGSLSLNDQKARQLVNKPTTGSTISYQDFRGKSAVQLKLFKSKTANEAGQDSGKLGTNMWVETVPQGFNVKTEIVEYIGCRQYSQLNTDIEGFKHKYNSRGTATQRFSINGNNVSRIVYYNQTTTALNHGLVQIWNIFTDVGVKVRFSVVESPDVFIEETVMSYEKV